MSLEKIRQVYNPAACDPLVFSGRFKGRLVSDQEYAEVVSLYNRAILRSLPAFIAGRTYMFCAAMGAATTNLYYADFLRAPDWRKSLPEKNVFHLNHHPVSRALSVVQDRYLKWSLDDSWRMVFWNTHFSLLLFCGSVLAGRWLPISAMVSCVILVQAACLFPVMPSADFRYLYFMYFCGFLFVPLLLTEIRLRARKYQLPRRDALRRNSP